MPTAAKSLARWVTPHRVLLIKHYSQLYPGTARRAAEYLTLSAVKAGYISPRQAIPGETLKQWVLQSNAPFWACQAAFDYLHAHHWQPANDVERAIYARFSVANEITIDKVMQQKLEPFYALALRAQQDQNNDDLL